jgi:hypothetical protein
MSDVSGTELQIDLTRRGVNVAIGFFGLAVVVAIVGAVIILALLRPGDVGPESYAYPVAQTTALAVELEAIREGRSYLPAEQQDLILEFVRWNFSQMKKAGLTSRVGEDRVLDWEWIFTDARRQLERGKEGEGR